MKRTLYHVALLVALALMWLALVSPVKAAGYGSYTYHSNYSYYPMYYAYKEIPVYKDVYRVKDVYVPQFVQVPLYGSYYTPPAANCAGHAQTPAAAPKAPMPDAAPAAPASDACAATKAKLDRVEAQMELLLRILGPQGGPPPVAAPEKLPPSKAPVPPKAPAPKAPPPKAPPPTKEPTSADSVQAGVNAMYTACAKCHEAKVSATDGGGFTMFDGVKVAALSERAWAKVEREVEEGKMPPKKDKDGNVIQQPAPEQRKAILAFLAERKRQAGAAE